MIAFDDPDTRRRITVEPPTAPVRPADVANAEFGLARNGVDPDQLDELLERVQLSLTRS